MKLSRFVWVVIANALAVLINAMQLVANMKLKVPDDQGVWRTMAHVSAYHWLYISYLAIRVIVPILGIGLEVIDLQLTKWVNAGYFTVMVVVSYGLSLLPALRFYGYSGQLLLIPISAAGVTYFLYSKWWISSHPHRASFPCGSGLLQSKSTSSWRTKSGFFKFRA